MAMAIGTRAVAGRTPSLATMTAISCSSSPSPAVHCCSRAPFSPTHFAHFRVIRLPGEIKASLSSAPPPLLVLCKQESLDSSSISPRGTFLAALRRGPSRPWPSSSGRSTSQYQQKFSSASPPVAAVDGEVAASATAAVAPPTADVDALEIKVGRVVKAWKHPEADSLYVEEVDLAEPEGPRTICSGLVDYMPLEELQGRAVLVLANLKARNMRGVKSNGMLLAASNQEHTIVQLLSPPESATPGERAWFGEAAAQEGQSPPGTPNQVQKKKVWETVQPLLKTDDECVATFQSRVMRTSTGVVRCQSLQRASIS